MGALFIIKKEKRKSVLDGFPRKENEIYRKEKFRDVLTSLAGRLAWLWALIKIIRASTVCMCHIKKKRGIQTTTPTTRTRYDPAHTHIQQPKEKYIPFSSKIKMFLFGLKKKEISDGRINQTRHIETNGESRDGRYSFIGFASVMRNP
jgi:hypothetical protein